ncbi:MAG: DUF1501 domain-containing protein [Phycisphaera sp.]|nr:DUF1501 domain-containing protein [Phycisphaera sp.]
MLTRRQALRLGALGLSLPGLMALQGRARAASPDGAPAQRGGGFGRAKSCIVLYAWGGMSHLDTFDMKPDGPSEIRGQFNPIPTSVPGVQISEHLPMLAKRMHLMTVVRSVHHAAPSHRSACYWNLTGHTPTKLDANWEASRADWPCIGSQVWAAQTSGAAARVSSALPGAVCLPYPMHDGGYANGQDGGFLGLPFDPVVMRPAHGREYEGKSSDVGTIRLGLVDGVSPNRLAERRTLLRDIESTGLAAVPRRDAAAAVMWRNKALDMLADPAVRDAFDIDTEPAALRAAYGDHICGTSTLLARKLTEAGVPLATVYCSAGDLNGSVGAHFDTHADNFNRLKNQMLPPLDQAMSALLDDLQQRGRLDDTLVVLLTEFGRTPKINGGAGRDHFPNCYSVAFAGGGVSRGLVYGASNVTGAEPAELGCGPADLHATIFSALGIDPRSEIHDMLDRPFTMCDGKPLPIFA